MAKKKMLFIYNPKAGKGQIKNNLCDIIDLSLIHILPRELMLQEEIEDTEIVEQWLSNRRGSRVHIRVPKKGTKEKLVELAATNAALVLSKDRERIKREEGRTIGAVKEICALLSLPEISRMEAFDISNISGFENVGSMVVYEKGKPKRSDYRKFKIRTVSGPDDYACMKEIGRAHV